MREELCRDTPKRVSVSRDLRQRAVPAEALLWKALRNRALGGFQFRRQHPIRHFVTDFACVECRLGVEADGESHLLNQAADTARDQFLREAGWHVLRF